jgi:TRAP-type C4-dicarboxylate transport system permease small subunit
MEILDRISTFLNRLLLWIGGIFLVGMIILTCSNIIFRLTWVPVKGTFELMGYCGAIVTAFALGHTQIKRGHIAVDVLVNRFSDKVRKIINAINYTVCFLFFSVAAWQIAVKATTLMNTGEITETLRIIYYPFTYGVAVGCAVLSLVLFTELVGLFSAEKEDTD